MLSKFSRIFPVVYMQRIWWPRDNTAFRDDGNWKRPLHSMAVPKRNYPIAQCRANAVILVILPEPWWLHQMETFSALLAICAENAPVTGEFSTQWPVRRSFDVFINVWVKNCQAGDWRRHHAHYDVIVMSISWATSAALNLLREFRFFEETSICLMHMLNLRRSGDHFN